MSGEKPVTALSRVSNVVADTGVPVRYQIAGNIDALGRPVLSLRVTGEVGLVCQRCLEPMVFPFALATDLVVFRYEDQLAEAEALDPELEALLVEEAGDLMVLVEDEILLALPFAPRHDHCVDLPGSDEGPEELNAASPFAALAALKQRN